MQRTLASSDDVENWHIAMPWGGSRPPNHMRTSAPLQDRLHFREAIGEANVHQMLPTMRATPDKSSSDSTTWLNRRSSMPSYTRRPSQAPRTVPGNAISTSQPNSRVIKPAADCVANANIRMIRVKGWNIARPSYLPQPRTFDQIVGSGPASPETKPPTKALASIKSESIVISISFVGSITRD